jgi:hypothetical protein
MNRAIISIEVLDDDTKEANIIVKGEHNGLLTPIVKNVHCVCIS